MDHRDQPRQDAAPIVAIGVPVVERSFESKIEAEKRHDNLLKDIDALKTVEECSALYDSARFQESMRTLCKEQDDFVHAFIAENPAIAPDAAKEEWAKLWALELSRNEDWAWSLNYMRKAALQLLYKLCNLCPDAQQLERDFQRNRLDQILFHCVVMDRANCLYNMTDVQTYERGLGWYSKGDEELYKALRDPPLPLNPEKHTINKRLRWLQRNLYAQDVTIARWLTIEAPARLVAQE